MKKIFTLAVMMLAITISYAQTKIGYGVKAGMNFASITGDANTQLNNLLELSDGMVKTSGRTGYHVGAYLQVPLTENLLLEPALLYSRKGYELEGNFDFKMLELLGISARAELISQYIDLPLVLKAKLGKGFQVYAGPQVSYMLRSDLRARAGLLGINLLNEKFDVSGSFNNWDAALTAGLAYQFGNGVNVYAGYDHGLTRIDANRSVDARNKVFRVGMGVSF
ncbi:PorT family protein [Flavihumibacter rivuli]|uniref:porin family protein n=1 Tax=Flavihumibacter rivuli TaxID=2838156 RepID=UPI001BDE301A|nr:porin family protein [Flavihumibacter rivuli]ULQ57290.1 PorT family protein [Flavihumibacter rivuli]